VFEYGRNNQLHSHILLQFLDKKPEDHIANKLDNIFRYVIKRSKNINDIVIAKSDGKKNIEQYMKKETKTIEEIKHVKRVTLFKASNKKADRYKEYEITNTLNELASWLKPIVENNMVWGNGFFSIESYNHAIKLSNYPQNRTKRKEINYLIQTKEGIKQASLRLTTVGNIKIKLKNTIIDKQPRNIIKVFQIPGTQQIFPVSIEDGYKLYTSITNTKIIYKEKKEGNSKKILVDSTETLLNRPMLYLVTPTKNNIKAFLAFYRKQIENKQAAKHLLSMPKDINKFERHTITAIDELVFDSNEQPVPLIITGYGLQKSKFRGLKLAYSYDNSKQRKEKEKLTKKANKLAAKQQNNDNLITFNKRYIKDETAYIQTNRTVYKPYKNLQ
jgi:hypothetical protein